MHGVLCMRRALALTLGLLTLATLAGCKKKSVCGPYLAMNIPGVTKIDRCDAEPTSDYGIGGETTATGAELVSAIAASGFEIGRDGESRFGDNNHRVFFRKDGATYLMFTDLRQRQGGANFFSITPERGALLRAWVPEASWQKLVTARADRRAFIESLRPLRDVLGKSAGAPAKCDAALDSLDPKLADAPKSLLVNLDSRDFKGRDAGRGPATFTNPEWDENVEYSAKVSRLLTWREEIDRAAARRVVPVLVITDYVPVKTKEPPAGDRIRISWVSGGEAKFDVFVVDRRENRILCRSRAEAKIGSKAPKPKNAPKLQRPDGKSVEVWLEGLSPEDMDLSAKIAEAAKAELARMSPVFAR